MEITNLFFNQLQSTSNNLKQNTISSTTAKSSFDNHYESYKNNYNSQELNKNSNTSNSIKKTSTSSKTIKNDDMKKSKINNNSNNNNKKSQSKDEISEDFIEELAEKLNISVKEIKDLLDELNMSIFDLLDVNNFNNFMQNLLDVENPIDMITSDELQSAYSLSTDVVEKYKKILNESVDLSTENTTSNIEFNKEENITDDIKETLSDKVAPKENQENLDEITEQKESPLIEIKNTTKGNNSQFKGNSEQSQNQNETLLTQDTNQNFNYVNTYNYQQFQQQAIVDDIVSNISNASSTKDVHQIINQIVDKIKVDIKPDVSEMKLLLKPDTLGELSLKITTQNNIVTAQFVAESQQVKEVLQANFNNLKDTLQQLGLIIDEISVSVGQQNSESRQQFEQNQQKSKHRMSQIINSINDSEDISVENNYDNPYELSDNQVDYMA